MTPHHRPKPPHAPRPDDAAVLRYLSGESSLAEAQAIEEWLATDAKLAASVAALKTAWSKPASPEVEWDKSGVWEKIAAETRPAGRADQRWERRRLESPRLIAIAAALIIALGLGEGVLTWRARVGERRSAVAATDRATREIATTKGQRAQVTLGDGSKVLLGVASRLRFPTHFGTRGRELFLEGTAYFEVVHDSTQPFVVRTADAVAEDIGTKFVVTAYPGSRATQVVVAEGAVSLGALNAAGAHRVRVDAGQLGQVPAGDSTPRVRQVDVTQYTAWTRGELVFRNAPLRDVVAELRRWYDVDLRIGDSSIASVPLTGTFGAESLQEALSFIEAALPIRADRNGRRVTFYHHRRSGVP